MSQDAVLETVVTEEATVPAESTTEVAETTSSAPAVPAQQPKGLADLAAALGYSPEELKGLSGLQNLNPNDYRIPYAKFYAKAATGRDLGDFELPDGTILKLLKNEEVLKDISMLTFQDVRVMFPTPYKATNKRICRSLDGHVGAPDGEYAGDECLKCEFAKYPEDGGASPCREQKLVLLRLPNGMRFFTLVSGVSVGEFKKSFVSMEMDRGLAETRKIYGMNLLPALNLQLTAEIQDTVNGPVPKMVFKLNPEKGQELHSLERLGDNVRAYDSYLQIQEEAVDTAASFAQVDQVNYAEPAQENGVNNGVF